MPPRKRTTPIVKTETEATKPSASTTAGNARVTASEDGPAVSSQPEDAKATENTMGGTATLVADWFRGVVSMVRGDDEVDIEVPGELIKEYERVPLEFSSAVFRCVDKILAFAAGIKRRTLFDTIYASALSTLCKALEYNPDNVSSEDSALLESEERALVGRSQRFSCFGRKASPNGLYFALILHLCVRCLSGTQIVRRRATYFLCILLGKSNIVGTLLNYTESFVVNAPNAIVPASQSFHMFELHPVFAVAHAALALKLNDDDELVRRAIAQYLPSTGLPIEYVCMPGREAAALALAEAIRRTKSLPGYVEVFTELDHSDPSDDISGLGSQGQGKRGAGRKRSTPDTRDRFESLVNEIRENLAIQAPPQSFPLEMFVLNVVESKQEIANISFTDQAHVCGVAPKLQALRFVIGQLLTQLHLYSSNTTALINAKEENVRQTVIRSISETLTPLARRIVQSRCRQHMNPEEYDQLALSLGTESQAVQNRRISTLPSQQQRSTMGSFAGGAFIDDSSFLLAAPRLPARTPYSEMTRITFDLDLKVGGRNQELPPTWIGKRLAMRARDKVKSRNLTPEMFSYVLAAIADRVHDAAPPVRAEAIKALGMCAIPVPYIQPALLAKTLSAALRDMDDNNRKKAQELVCILAARCGDPATMLHAAELKQPIVVDDTTALALLAYIGPIAYPKECEAIANALAADACAKQNASKVARGLTTNDFDPKSLLEAIESKAIFVSDGVRLNFAICRAAERDKNVSDREVAVSSSSLSSSTTIRLQGEDAEDSAGPPGPPSNAAVVNAGLLATQRLAAARVLWWRCVVCVSKSEDVESGAIPMNEEDEAELLALRDAEGNVVAAGASAVAAFIEAFQRLTVDFAFLPEGYTYEAFKAFWESAPFVFNQMLRVAAAVDTTDVMGMKRLREAIISVLKCPLPLFTQAVPELLALWRRTRTSDLDEAPFLMPARQASNPMAFTSLGLLEEVSTTLRELQALTPNEDANEVPFAQEIQDEVFDIVQHFEQLHSHPDSQVDSFVLAARSRLGMVTQQLPRDIRSELSARILSIFANLLAYATRMQGTASEVAMVIQTLQERATNTGKASPIPQEGEANLEIEPEDQEQSVPSLLRKFKKMQSLAYAPDITTVARIAQIVCLLEIFRDCVYPLLNEFGCLNPHAKQIFHREVLLNLIRAVGLYLLTFSSHGDFFKPNLSRDLWSWLNKIAFDFEGFKWVDPNAHFDEMLGLGVHSRFHLLCEKLSHRRLEASRAAFNAVVDCAITHDVFDFFPILSVASGQSSVRTKPEEDAQLSQPELTFLQNLQVFDSAYQRVVQARFGLEQNNIVTFVKFILGENEIREYTAGTQEDTALSAYAVLALGAKASDLTPGQRWERFLHARRHTPQNSKTYLDFHLLRALYPLIHCVDANQLLPVTDEFQNFRKNVVEGIARLLLHNCVPASIATHLISTLIVASCKIPSLTVLIIGFLKVYVQQHTSPESAIHIMRIMSMPAPEDALALKAWVDFQSRAEQADPNEYSEGCVKPAEKVSMTWAEQCYRNTYAMGWRQLPSCASISQYLNSDHAHALIAGNPEFAYAVLQLPRDRIVNDQDGEFSLWTNFVRDICAGIEHRKIESKDRAQDKLEDEDAAQPKLYNQGTLSRLGAPDHVGILIDSFILTVLEVARLGELHDTSPDVLKLHEIHQRSSQHGFEGPFIDTTGDHFVSAYARRLRLEVPESLYVSDGKEESSLAKFVASVLSGLCRVQIATNPAQPTSEERIASHIQTLVAIFSRFLEEILSPTFPSAQLGNAVSPLQKLVSEILMFIITLQNILGNWEGRAEPIPFQVVIDSLISALRAVDVAHLSSSSPFAFPLLRPVVGEASDKLETNWMCLQQIRRRRLGPVLIWRLLNVVCDNDAGFERTSRSKYRAEDLRKDWGEALSDALLDGQDQGQSDEAIRMQALRETTRVLPLSVLAGIDLAWISRLYKLRCQEIIKTIFTHFELSPSLVPQDLQDRLGSLALPEDYRVRRLPESLYIHEGDAGATSPAHESKAPAVTDSAMTSSRGVSRGSKRQQHDSSSAAPTEAKEASTTIEADGRTTAPKRRTRLTSLATSTVVADSDEPQETPQPASVRTRKRTTHAAQVKTEEE